MKIFDYCKGAMKWLYGKENLKYSIPYIICVLVSTFSAILAWYSFGKTMGEIDGFNKANNELREKFVNTTFVDSKDTDK